MNKSLKIGLYVLGLVGAAGLIYWLTRKPKETETETETSETQGDGTTPPVTTTGKGDVSQGRNEPVATPHIKELVVKLVANKPTTGGIGTTKNVIVVRKYPSSAGEIITYINNGAVVGYALKSDWLKAVSRPAYIQLLDGRFDVSGKTQYAEKYVNKEDVKIVGESMM